MDLRFAFIGFRHPHIFSLYEAVQHTEGLTCVAACEEDAATAATIKEQGKANLTHEDAAEMLANVDCDVVGIGDAYGRRGTMAIAALEAGRHVISDKPICTRLEELDRIEQLAHDKGLSVGCQLDLRDLGECRAARRLIRDGQLGQVHTVNFTGQHPLNYGSRPEWYFEQGMHGGTINDIAVHAFDLIPWFTDRQFTRITAARTWNQSFTQVPHFQLGAQIMLELDNQGGVLGDVSYLAPKTAGYRAPQYWRFTLHGDHGMLELAIGTHTMIRLNHDDQAPVPIEPDPARSHGYLHDFVEELRNKPANPSALTTHAVLQAARWSLRTQASGDSHDDSDSASVMSDSA